MTATWGSARSTLQNLGVSKDHLAEPLMGGPFAFPEFAKAAFDTLRKMAHYLRPSGNAPVGKRPIKDGKRPVTANGLFSVPCYGGKQPLEKGLWRGL